MDNLTGLQMWMADHLMGNHYESLHDILNTMKFVNHDQEYWVDSEVFTSKVPIMLLVGGHMLLIIFTQS